ncbi:apolipoprotein N-acyltransferase [Planctomycetota bacterium]
MSEKDGATAMKLPVDYRLRHKGLSGATVALLTTVTMLLLTVIAEPIGWQWLAWMALGPWVVAAVRAKNGGRSAMISYLGGLIYFFFNLKWLAPVTLAGYIGLCFYLGWYFVLSGYILRRIYQHREWSFTLVLPVVWVGQEYLRAWLLTGFPWLFLGHSLHENIRLMQLCDTFGAYGLTFLVAMVNGLWCDLLLRPLVRSNNRGRGSRLDAISSILITACCIAAAVVYGQFRLNQGKSAISKGRAIAVIQEAIPQYVKEAGESDEEIFQKHLTLSEEALAAEVTPELIVWPETMVPAPLNDEFLNAGADFLTEAGRSLLTKCLSYDNRLRELSGKGVNVLTGAITLTLPPVDPSRRYNSAFLYLSDGQRFPKRYDKMHLVPFGEVVPFKESWPWLYGVLNSLTPYDYEYSLDAGDEPTVFEIKPQEPNSTTLRFGVAICYEDVMPQVPRRLAAAEKGKKRVDFLLNISNDGWFVTGGQGTPLNPSAELLQHLVICKFRAVENRVGIVRAVNTGISAFIRPDGRVQEGYLAGTLPENHAQRQAVAGFLTDNVYLDRRISLYSIIGDSFAIACTVLTGFLFIGGILMQSRWEKKGKSIR